MTKICLWLFSVASYFHHRQKTKEVNEKMLTWQIVVVVIQWHAHFELLDKAAAAIKVSILSHFLQIDDPQVPQLEPITVSKVNKLPSRRSSAMMLGLTAMMMKAVMKPSLGLELCQQRMLIRLKIRTKSVWMMPNPNRSKFHQILLWYIIFLAYTKFFS